jgi:hypothetical protein
VTPIRQVRYHVRHAFTALYRSIGFRTVPVLPLAVKKLRRSNTLFVLGSGASIVEIRQWEQVRKNDSVGFNFWLLHDFVPDIYFVEAPREMSERDCLVRNLKRVKGRYEGVSIFNKVRLGCDAIGVALTECGLTHRAMLPVAFNASSREELRFHAAVYRRSTLMRNLLFYCQGVATVELVVLFGWILGYQKIVLCGIDLNDTDYFYYDSSYTELAADGYVPPLRQCGRIHKTNDPSLAWGGMAVSEVLRIFQDDILGRGCQIFVESETSALAASFPIHSLR